MKLDPRLKMALGEMGEGGSMLLEADGTPAVVARLPVFTTKGTAVGFGEIQLADYEPEGPVIVLIFRWFDNPANPLVFEVFLNPASAGDQRLLGKLATAQHLHLHVFGTERGVPYLGSKQLDWRPDHREGAARVLRETMGKRTLWPAAKNRYQREHPLS